MLLVFQIMERCFFFFPPQWMFRGEAVPFRWYSSFGLVLLYFFHFFFTFLLFLCVCLFSAFRFVPPRQCLNDADTFVTSYDQLWISCVHLRRLQILAYLSSSLPFILAPFQFCPRGWMGEYMGSQNQVCIFHVAHFFISDVFSPSGLYLLSLFLFILF